jgi:hypothetical protein
LSGSSFCNPGRRIRQALAGTPDGRAPREQLTAHDLPIDAADAPPAAAIPP